MTLLVELRLQIVEVTPEGVFIQPEYWHGDKCIHRPSKQLVRPGEVMLYGPHWTEVQFQPPAFHPVQL